MGLNGCIIFIIGAGLPELFQRERINWTHYDTDPSLQVYPMKKN